MRDVFPKGLAAFIAWLLNFNTEAEVNMILLNMTQPQIDELKVQHTKLVTAQTNVVATKAAAKDAVESKDMAMEETAVIVRKWVNIFRAMEIPDNILESLGLKVHDTIPSHEVPNPATLLVVKGLGVGINELDWNGNLNKSGTQYIIEAKYGLEAPFQMVDTVTATKYQHEGQTPGVAVFYRITARRGKLKSIPSETVGVYTGL